MKLKGFVTRIYYLHFMKKYFLIIVLCSFAFFIKAQSNFVKGIIIDNNGDSIHGTIDYRNWRNNPVSISFKTSANQNKVLSTVDIKGFWVPSVNEVYTRFTVDIDMLPPDADDAIHKRFTDSSLLRKTVFLLQLIKHPTLALYQFTRGRKQHYYYAQGNGEAVELMHHYLYDEKNNFVEEKTPYKEQLSGLFTACPRVALASQKIKFRVSEIQDLFEKYLQCVAPSSGTIVKPKEGIIAKFGLVAGASINNFELKGSNIYLADDNYSSNVSPVAGVSLDLVIPRSGNKWHIVNELVYKSYKTGSQFDRPYGNGYTANYDVNIAFSYAQVNIMGRYVFQPGNSIKPFINIGVGNGFILTETNNKTNVSYSFGREENGKAIDRPNRYEFSLLAGAGVSIRKASIELRYGGSKKSFSPDYTLDINAKSYSFLFSYQF
jgi:opacity protein-like surface antigen